MIPDRDQQGTATVLIAHRDDEAMGAMVGALAEFAEHGIVSEHVRVLVGSDDRTADAVRWSGSVAGVSGAAAVPLVFDHLARVGHLDVLQVVSLCAAPGDRDLARALSGAAARFEEALEVLLGHGTRVLPARIAVPAYGEGMINREFFSTVDGQNLVAIPLDRADDRSAARPIERWDVDAFRDHGAIEIASVCGLWSATGAGVLDALPTRAVADGGPRVRLCRSTVRFVRTPVVPVRDLVAESRELPIPERCHPAPNPLRRTSALFDAVRTEALVYEPPSPPELHRSDMAYGRFVGLVASSVSAILGDLPRLVGAGVRGEALRLSVEAANRAIGGDESSVRIVAGDDGARAPSQEAPVGDGRPAAARDVPILDPVPGDVWTQLSGRILGVIDGDAGAAEFRRSALGDAAIVPTDRGVLLGGVDWSALWAVGGGTAPAEPTPPERLLKPLLRDAADWVKDLLPEPPEAAASPTTAPQGGTSGDADDADAAPVTSDAPDAPTDAALVDGGGDAPADTSSTDEAAKDVPIWQAGAPPELPDPVDAEGDGLLLRVLTDLHRQRRAAALDRRRLEALRVARLTREEVRVSPLVPALAVLGATMLFVLLAASDLGNRFVMTEGIVATVRDGIFVTVAVALVFWALWLTGLLRGGLAQTRFTILVTAAGGTLAAGLLGMGRVRASLDPAALRSHSLPLSVLVGAAVLVGIAWWQSRRSGDDFRIASARLLVSALVVSGIVGVAVLQARDGSSLRAVMESESRVRVLSVLAIIGTLLLLSALASLTTLRYRSERRLDRAAEVQRWAGQAIGFAEEADRRLHGAQWQWIGTASVLARLVRLPFGAAPPARPGITGALVDTTVLKAPHTTLELTDRGREAIDTRLRALLVSPGWLRTRYEQLVQAYQRFLSRRSGINAAELVDRRPEQDVHAPVVDGTDLSELRGDRWEFARMHAEGRFDDVLAEAAEAIDLEVVYGPVLAEAGAQTLVGGEEGDAITVREFMERILPSAPPEIGPGLVDELFSAADERRRMATFVWWPRGMLGPMSVEGAEVGASRLVRDRAEGSVIVTAARTDVSGPFAHERCLVSEG